MNRNRSVGRAASRITVVFGVIALAVTTVTGCTPSAADTAAPAESADASLAALVPDAIKSDGLTVGGNFEYAPWVSKTGSDFTGIDADLARAVGSKLGITVTFVDAPFESLIPSLQSGRIDVVWSAMYDTEERRQAIDLIDYYTSPWGFIVAKGNPLGLNAMTDLCGARVALSTGSASIDMVRAQSDTCVADGKPAIEVNIFADDSASELSIRSNRNDVSMQDYSTLAYHAEASDGALEAVAVTDLPQTPYGVGIMKTSTQLRDALVAGLQAIIDDGTYAEILKQYGITEGLVEKVGVNGADL